MVMCSCTDTRQCKNPALWGPSWREQAVHARQCVPDFVVGRAHHQVLEDIAKHPKAQVGEAVQETHGLRHPFGNWGVSVTALGVLSRVPGKLPTAPAGDTMTFGTLSRSATTMPAAERCVNWCRALMLWCAAICCRCSRTWHDDVRLYDVWLKVLHPRRMSKSALYRIG